MRRYTSFAAAVSSTLAASWWAWKWIIGLGFIGIVASFLFSNAFVWTVVLVGSSQVFTTATGLAIFSWLHRARRREDATNPQLRVERFASTYYVRADHRYELRQEISI